MVLRMVGRVRGARRRVGRRKGRRRRAWGVVGGIFDVAMVEW